MAEIDKESMKNIFLEESRELLKKIQQNQKEARVKRKYTPENIYEIYKSIHTIKVDTQMMGFHSMSEVSWTFEKILHIYRAEQINKLPFSQLDFLIDEILNFYYTELKKVETGEKITEDYENLKKKIEKDLENLLEIKQELDKSKGDVPIIKKKETAEELKKQDFALNSEKILLEKNIMWEEEVILPPKEVDKLNNLCKQLKMLANYENCSAEKDSGLILLAEKFHLWFQRECMSSISEIEILIQKLADQLLEKYNIKATIYFSDAPIYVEKYKLKTIYYTIVVILQKYIRCRKQEKERIITEKEKEELKIIFSYREERKEISIIIQDCGKKETQNHWIETIQTDFAQTEMEHIKGRIKVNRNTDETSEIQIIIPELGAAFFNKEKKDMIEESINSRR